MQFKSPIFLGAVMIMGAFASPVPHHPRHHPRDAAVIPGLLSFNDFGGLNSLNGFDDFFGANNFIGLNQQLIASNNQLVCRAQQVNVVQQQLLVVQELTKQIILEAVCDVEAQVVLLQQLVGGLNVFANDLLRLGDRVPSFDRHISGLGSSLFKNGALNIRDLGVRGVDLGHELVVVGGDNWVDDRSRDSVRFALDAAEAAKLAALQQVRFITI